LLILLPPSETKRDGGAGEALDIASLRFPRLSPIRRKVVRAVRSLSRDEAASAAALKLGRTQLHEVARNRAVAESATMPAIDRYTGVLYDGLDAASLSPAAREFAGRNVVIHSALLGPVGALDLIPAYRLSTSARLPGLRLKEVWSAAVSKELVRSDGLVLDLRSESYVALGPVAAHPDAHFLRVVTGSDDGQKRALNHFNKKSKGEFTRALLTDAVELGTVTQLLEWAGAAGFRVATGRPGELELTVDEQL
jgi:cytoplasmic iron level regulating protein YaaA (DUF328/UPF0246 family)